MFEEKEEKKVEYLELIYDLIFVYMVGRNNSLLHVQDGFVEPKMFVAYILCTLAIIQIWNFTTFYINMFGRNSLREHVFLFINMYLMYFVAEGTRQNWQEYQSQYHIAWALILVNIGIQYGIELRHHKADVWNRDFIKRMMINLFIEAALVLVAAYPNTVVGTAFSALAILFGVFATAIGKNKYHTSGLIDFPHLTERAMLYVVFTFGEMIIAIASYFEGNGGFDLNLIYFSLMAFLIVVGLFLSYGIFYDHLIDREMEDNGLVYMAFHIFILFALNNITTALEFMREEEVDLMPKMLFLVLSIAGYYVFLFLLGKYAKNRCKPDRKFILKMILSAVCFVAVMMLLREVMVANILITVIYVFVIFFVIYRLKEKK